MNVHHAICQEAHSQPFVVMIGRELWPTRSNGAHFLDASDGDEVSRARRAELSESGGEEPSSSVAICDMRDVIIT